MNSHSHIFMPSKKKDLCYCKICYKLSYKGKICQSLPFNDENRFGLDPLTLKFKPIISISNYKLPENIKYLEYKNKGISKIKYLINNFGLKSMIYFKSISFMNQIFLENDISLDYIDNIASICVLLATKYNECCIPSKYEEELNENEKEIFYHLLNNNEQGKKYKSNLRGLISFIKNNVDNYKYWEILCLKYLNYDLGRYSAYDYLILFFQLGIFFCEKEINVIDKLKKCINVLDLIIYDKKYCDFSQYTFALSIIKVFFENDNLFDTKIIKYIYGVDLSKIKYIKCSNLIKNIINQSIKNENTKTYFNMLYNILYFNQLNIKYFPKIKENNVNNEEEKNNQTNLAKLKNTIINDNNYIIFDNKNNFVSNNKCIDNNYNNFNSLINNYYLFNNNNID